MCARMCVQHVEELRIPVGIFYDHDMSNVMHEGGSTWRSISNAGVWNSLFVDCPLPSEALPENEVHQRWFYDIGCTEFLQRKTARSLVGTPAWRVGILEGTRRSLQMVVSGSRDLGH